MFRNEQQVYQLIEEAKTILTHISSNGHVINQAQASRLFDIVTEVGAADISDSGKKNFSCLLFHASLSSGNQATRSIYQRLVSEFAKTCSPLFNVEAEPQQQVACTA